MTTKQKLTKYGTLLIFIYLLYAFIIILSFPPESPPGASAMNAIRKEYYRHFLTTGNIPNNPSFLSSVNQQRMKIYGFTVNKKNNTITYTYDKAYPINTKGKSLKYLSLGVLSQCASSSMGEGITPESIKHNAPILRDAGKL